MSDPRQILLLWLAAALLWAGCASAHMSMSNPPPLRYKTNPYKAAQDYDHSSPLSPSGSNYPCKGYLSDLGTPAGQSVASYSVGGTYEITLEGSATHAGGSCQLSLSFDGGETFQVIWSRIGGCVNPDPGGPQNFEFSIPMDTPGGEAILAWSWYNNLGNREFYMNCAVVTISGWRRFLHPRAVAMATRNRLARRASGPEIFLANLGNGCTTVAGTDVEFPDPGPNTEYGGSGKSAPPQGSCGAVKGYTGSGGGGGGSGGGSGNCAYWRKKGYVCAGAPEVRVKWLWGLLLVPVWRLLWL